jgi:pyridoxine 4-dehydrogenase
MIEQTDLAGNFTLPSTSITVNRMGYGAMQLAGRDGNKLVWGPPRDIDGAIALLREVVASGVNHIDTADFYGPHVTNQIIRKALYPYPDDLVIVTKVSARRGEDGSWIPAFSREELTAAIHDNLRNLGLDVLDVVNLRSMHSIHEPAEGSIEAPLTVLAELQQKGFDSSYRAQQCHARADCGSPTDRSDRLRAEPVQPRASNRRCTHRRSCS